LNSTSKVRQPISPRFRAELEDFFRADVEKLSGLLGRDLSPWLSERRELERPPGGRENI
jgi:hypothetical protein